mmetsp:Transcript_2081/g.5759  ORF Transcript_2081/g.5759 Transcript_2081/m.5759 type:complete len:112 (-) Transcript_2081:156-491(-)
MVIFGVVIIASALRIDEGQGLYSAASGCLLLACLGSILALLDPLRHIFLDHDVLMLCGISLPMYEDDGGLTPTGRACQIFSILGVSLLTIAILWLMEMPRKVYHLCKHRLA